MAVLEKTEQPAADQASKPGSISRGWQPGGHDTSVPATGTAIVTVAVKHPHGVVLRAFRMVDTLEVTRDGSRTIKEGRSFGQPFTTRGNASFMHVLPNLREQLDQSGGFALTDGCPKDLWDNWLENNIDSDLVRNGLIFAGEDRVAVVAECLKRASLQSGLEPIDPANPNAKSGMRPTANLSAPQLGVR